jgi:probable addiction module antidote protein
MVKQFKNYETDLIERLKDQNYAVEYLNAVLEDPSEDQQERFLMALRDVAQAHGIASVAKDSKVAREALYRTLSKDGNPELATLLSVLSSLGLKIKVTVSVDEAS